MSKNGVILGKAEGSTITLNKDLADKGTLSHELYHSLIIAKMILKSDRLVLQGKFNAMKKNDRNQSSEGHVSVRGGYDHQDICC